MSNQNATLIAYTPSGEMVYKTKEYLEVLEFKRICTTHGIEYAVRFSQDIQINKQAHIRKPWYKKLFS